MTITKNTEGNKVTLTLSGWLDTQAAPELTAELNALGPDVEQLEIDMKDCEYISSSGVRQLVAAHKKMKGNLVIRNVSKEILDVFTMTGVAAWINIEPAAE
jgi:anti-anti-sigma factor